MNAIPSHDDLLDAAPCGILSFRDDGTILMVNATLLELLGYERPELVGRHVESLLTLGSRIFYQTHLFPLVRIAGKAEEIFLTLRCRDGSEVGVLLNAARRERGGASVTDWAVMRVRERQKFEDELVRARRTAERARGELQAANQDLVRANEELQAQAVELELLSEELQKANDELLARTEELEHLRSVAEEANRAKSQFLAVMSHELRTPLNAIAGYVELLAMGIHGPVTEAQIHALRRVERSQRHLLRLINDILNLARIEAGRVEYHTEDVVLEELVSEVVPMVEPQVADKGLSLRVAIAPELAVRTDREKVQQILLNLLSNAIKFTPAGGLISVDAEVADGAPGRVELRVTDSGIGIPEDKLDTVFEPFVQVEVSHSSRAEGTGLGLAISRDLARGLGGELSARSRPGAGSTFSLSLPRASLTTSSPGLVTG